MWFENVVIILTWFTFAIVYLKICVKNKKIFNVIMLVLNIVFAMTYFFRNIIKIEMSNLLQFIIMLFMYIVPIITIYLTYNNIAIKQKIVCMLGKLYYNMGRYDVAIKLYTHSIKTNKNSINSNNYYILGRCLRKEKRYLDARDMFIEAIELDKSNYLAYYELGLTLSASDKKDTAIIMFSNALKVDSEFKEAKIALAITYSEIGRIKESVAIYNEMVEKEEADEEVLYNLANIYYYELNDLVKAEECYTKAIEFNGKLYAAWYNLGNINYLKGDYEESIKALNISRQNEVFRDKSEYMLAKNYIAIMENQKAKKLLEKLLKRDEMYIDKIKNEIIFEEILTDVVNKEK